MPPVAPPVFGAPINWRASRPLRAEKPPRSEHQVATNPTPRSTSALLRRLISAPPDLHRACTIAGGTEKTPKTNTIFAKEASKTRIGRAQDPKQFEKLAKSGLSEGKKVVSFGHCRRGV
jgi:hypothetical protein